MSFLTINTQYYNKGKGVGKYVKCMRCIGTHFDNVIFRNNTFSCCVFIACTGKLTFINSKFDTRSTFYNAKAEILFNNVEMTDKTADSLPEFDNISFI